MAVFCKLLVVLFVVLICRASEFGKWDFYAHGVEDVLGRMVRLDEYRGKVSSYLLFVPLLLISI